MTSFYLSETVVDERMCDGDPGSMQDSAFKPMNFLGDVSLKDKAFRMLSLQEDPTEVPCQA